MTLKTPARLSAFALAAGLVSLGFTVSHAAGTAPAQTTIAANLAQVNHVLVDDEWVYWTEVSPSQVRVRKMAKGGGPIVDLASEPAVGKGQVRSYVHLQQMGDRLFWSRLISSAGQRWSLNSVPKEGGTVERVLPEQIAVNPLYVSGWRVVGEELVVSLAAPEKLSLPANTRIAAYNPATGTWRPVLSDRFQKGLAFILATDASGAYVRGIDAKKGTEIGRLSVAEEPAYTPLFRQKETDRAVRETGAVDDSYVYYWSAVGGQRLRRVPVAGGASSPLYTGPLGFGLMEDEGFLYWDSAKKILRRSAEGGSTSRYFSPVFDTAAIGGLAYDADALYLVQQNRKKYSIVRVQK